MNYAVEVANDLDMDDDLGHIWKAVIMQKRQMLSKVGGKCRSRNLTETVITQEHSVRVSMADHQL